MFSFFLTKDRWKWNPAEGLPSKKVLKLQRQALHGGNNDTKKRLLEHIRDLADQGVEFQDALCSAKVTADVCKCFVTDAPSVQDAAAQTLRALCFMNLANCEAIVNAHYQVAPRGVQHVVPHAMQLARSFEKDIRLAISAVQLLETISACDAKAVATQLMEPGGMAAVLSIVKSCSSAALALATPAAQCRPLLLLTEVSLQMLESVAAGSGISLCRDLGKVGAVKLLLDLAREHRGQGPVQGSADGHGDHPAVVRAALDLLTLIVSQVPAQVVPLLEGDGVKRLLEVLRDMHMPWSVRMNAVGVLQNAASSPTAAAAIVGAKGLDVVFAMMDAFVNGKAGVGSASGSAAVTPPRGIAAAPAGAAAGSPGGAAGSLWSTTTLPEGTYADADAEEPRGVIVVEKLLGLVDALAGSQDAAAVLEGSRVGLLVAVFNCGMASFHLGGYRLATGSAQVLFRLACQPSLHLPALLVSPNVTGPLVALMDRGTRDYAAAADATQAQVVHGAWCGAGLLCKKMTADRSGGRTPQVLSSEALRGAVRLLDATAVALLAAFGAAPPQSVPDIGMAYLSVGRVVADLEVAATALLELLAALAEDVANRPALRQLDAPAAVKRILPWRKAQWRTKRLLHLMGELEAEYQPFVRYAGPLLAALLASQGVQPEPFLDRHVDGHILLSLEDDYLRNTLRLDEVSVLKVGRIRNGYALFAAMDAMDGRIDGCLTADDVERYLEDRCNMRPQARADLRERIFGELQVLPGEPICFLQFVTCYPWLEGELDACTTQTRQGSGLVGSGTPTGQGYGPRAFKRQRVGDAGGGGGAGAGGSTAGRNIIELE